MITSILLTIGAISLSAMLSSLLLVLFGSIAKKLAIVDLPDGKRKHHSGEVPLIGGLAVVFAVAISSLMIMDRLDQYGVLMLCIYLVLLVGFIDDFKDISVGLRVLAQLFVCTLMISSGGIQINNFGNILALGDIFFVDWAFPVTVLAFMTGINATNMVDGIDGLAASLTLISFIGLIILAILASYEEWIFLTLFVAALIPFLWFNLGLAKKTGKIFLGDAGSTVLGFVMVWFLIDWSQGSNPIFRPVTALWFIAVPLIDLICVSSRRIFRGQSPLKADSMHIHHLLCKLGLSNHTTLLVLCLIQATFITIGIYAEFNQTAEWILFFSFGFLILIIFLAVKKAWRVLDS